MLDKFTIISTKCQYVWNKCLLSMRIQMRDHYLAFVFNEQRKDELIFVTTLCTGIT
jgi:hypothetical protein